MRAWTACAVVGLGVAAAGAITWSVSRRAPAAPVQPLPANIAFQRAEHLRRGINLTGWYAQRADYSVAQLQAFMSVADMERLKRLGFDHVRLGINPEPLIREPQTGTLRRKAMAQLDKTVGELTSAGLNVVLNIQPEESWQKRVTSGAGSEEFYAFWTSFATHYAATDPDRVFFEVMNEPGVEDDHRWQGIEAEAVARIRGVAPRHTVIATGSPYGSIENLLGTQRLRDNDVIYTFHDYDPMWFTHQGAAWGSKGWAVLRGVPYPSNPTNTQAMLNRLLDQETEEQEKVKLKRFAGEQWDGEHIASEVESASAWAQRQGVPLYCGEFGVLKKYADPEARARWLTDVRTALEANHIGWAMWEYDGDFGLLKTTREEGRVDDEVLHALGLGK